MNKLKALLKQYEAAVNFRRSYLMKYFMSFPIFMLNPRKYGKADGEFYSMLRLDAMLFDFDMELTNFKLQYLDLKAVFLNDKIDLKTFIKELDHLLGIK